MTAGTVVLVAAGSGAPDLLPVRAARRLAGCGVVFVAPSVSLALRTSINGPEVRALAEGREIEAVLAEASEDKALGVLVEGGADRFSAALAERLEKEGVPFEVIWGGGERGVAPRSPALPLLGAQVVSTRMAHQDGPLREALEELGAGVISHPLLRLAGPSDPKRREAALDAVAGSDWAVFTSANAVDAFFASLAGRSMDVRSLCGRKIVAVGRATASALSARGIAADLIPELASSEGIVASLSARARPGERAILLRAEDGRTALSEGLSQLGLKVTEAALYRTIPAQSPHTDALRSALFRGEVDYMVLTSPKAVRQAIDVFSKPALLRCRVAALGPVTAEATAQAGLAVGPVSPSPRTDALIEILAEDWRKRHVSGT